MSRKGSATVLLCILFVTLTGALAITYEAAERKAAISVGEAAFDNAGRSVLACYDKELFDRYGLFAFEGDEEKTEQRLEKLAKPSIEKTKIAGCKVRKVEAEQSAFCLSDPDNLMLQIREITKRTAAEDVLSSLKDDLKTTRQKMKEKKQSGQKIQELESERDEAKRNAQAAVERARAAAEEEKTDDAVLQEDNVEETDLDRASAELEEIEKAESLHTRLKNLANKIKGEPDSDDSDGRTLRNGRVSESLPSVSAGYRGKTAFAGGTILNDVSDDGAGDAMSDDLVTVAYIDHFFRNKMDGDATEQNFFCCEMEYILYGALSDKENYGNAYRAIFAIRTAANTAYLILDPKKTEALSAIAELFNVPGALTELLILTLWGGLEAYNDMKNLENGNGVPLIKNDESWMIDIDGLVSLIKGESEGGWYFQIPGNSHMTYSRYLDILLLTVGKDTKLYRIMDLIQINLKGTVREDFTIADHFTGFALKAEIGKKSHAVGARSATADINMTHAYLTGG